MKYEEGLSRFFSGWERYGIKEADGRITLVHPDAMPALSLGLTPDDELFVGPDESVAAGYVLHDQLTEADLAKHKEPDGQWKPGRLVVETSPDCYQVWVVYEKDLTRAQRAQITGTNADEPLRPWARLTRDCRILHADGENQEKAPVQSHRMSPIFKKLGRYFGEFELGIHKPGEEKDVVWTIEQTEENIDYIKAMNARGCHIYIRPREELEPWFMFHDDLDEQGLEQYHKRNGRFKPGRLVVESSPGNYQVWIRSDRALPVEEKTVWLHKMESDPAAHPRRRFGRCPGFRNRKDKYKTDKGWPLARLKWIDWAEKARIPRIEIEPEPKPLQTTTAGLTPATVRSRASGMLPTRDDYYKGVDGKGKVKESEQDLAYAMALLRRNVPRHEVEDRIISERSDWGNHKGEKRRQDYLRRTLDKAESYLFNQSYTVTVKDTVRNVSTSATITDVSKSEAQAVLTEKAKEMALRMGFESSCDVQVDIKPAPKQSAGKKKDLLMALDREALCFE